MVKLPGIIGFLFLYLLPAVGQQKVADLSKLHGYLVNAADSTPVAFAHIHNENLRTSAITDSSGFFSVFVEGRDSLVFSAVNYYPRLFVSPVGENAADTIYVIMKERYYPIQEVSVFGVGTYQRFKQKVVDLDLPKTQTEKLRDSLTEATKKEAVQVYEEAKTKKMLSRESISQIPIATIPIYSKDEKQRMKLKKFLAKEKIQQRVYEKFNKDIIHRLTDMEEPELTEFYVYLDFSNKYVLNASDYDIRKRIVDEFKLYLKEKSKNERLDSILQ